MPSADMDKPLVSVVMATFNEPEMYITMAIRSVLNQTYTNLELIIADDSTRKETIEVIDRFVESDDRIILIRKAERMGFVSALNEGLKISHGKYVARMDGDDISLEDRLQCQVSYMEQHPNIDILGGAMNIMDKSGNIISSRSYPINGVKLYLWTIARNPIAHPTVMFRNTILHDGLLYDVNQKKAEDIEFWLRLKRKGYRLENMSQKLLNYRVEGDLSLKRTRNQWIYNNKARWKNFSWSFPLFSLASVVISSIYIMIPQRIIREIYKRENNKAGI